MAKVPEPSFHVLLLVIAGIRTYQVLQSVWGVWKGQSRDRHVKDSLYEEQQDRVPG